MTTTTSCTRKDYLDGKCTHSEYYGQFVTEGFKTRVSDFIGLQNILKSKDEHLNDIPLANWDLISPPIGTSERLKELGDYLTQAGKVCIAKAAARQIKQQGLTSK